MIVYFLPSAGRFGGIKVGFQFAETLRSLGVPVVVATPTGDAPQWFRCAVPVVDRRKVMTSLTPDDVAIFSLPHDHEQLSATEARLVLHCQGTSPLLSEVVRDQRVTMLACWQQAHEWLERESGRTPIDVGIAISDCFRPDSSNRRAGRIAHMPRRGRANLVEEAASARGLELIAIDGDDEEVVAAKMRSAEVFVALAEDEWFGLPALEAMASGCVVLSVPVIGGMEYLVDGRNAIVRPVEQLMADLPSLMARERATERAALSTAALTTSTQFRRSVQGRRLRSALAGELGEVLRCDSRS